MKCTICNKTLNDYESTRKHLITFEYLDICQECYVAADLDIIHSDRKDLLHESDTGGYADQDDLADYINNGCDDFDDIYTDR